MSITVFQIDAFALRAFEGNPAAVCILDRFPTDAFMQNVGREMNLSETAFVVPRTEAGAFDLRWFTPNSEVDLCGHATLAAAHRLFGEDTGTREVIFHTKSGALRVERLQDDRLRMDFPAEPVTESPRPPGLEAAVGAPVEFFGTNRMDALVQVSDAGWVRSLEPDLDWIQRQGWRGLIVTAQSDMDNIDFVSRGFFPLCGVSEDPVTGSAHCALSPFWHARLGRSELVGYQASDRGGLVHTHHRGDRVLLTGSAVTVLRGELLIEPEYV